MTAKGEQIHALKPDGSFLVEGAVVGDEDAKGKKTGHILLIDRESWFDWPADTEIPLVTPSDLAVLPTPKPLLGFHRRVSLAAYNSPFPIKGKGQFVEGVTDESIDAYFDTSDMRAIHDSEKSEQKAERMTMAMMGGMVVFILLGASTAFILAVSRLGG
jgi:hypothetical protein